MQQKYDENIAELLIDLKDTLKTPQYYIILTIPIEDMIIPSTLQKKAVYVNSVSNMPLDLQEYVCLMHMQYVRDNQNENSSDNTL